MKLKFFSAILLAGTLSTSFAADWGYTGAKAHEHWGGLSNNYALCASGQQQSPINFTKDDITPAKAKELKLGYSLGIPIDEVNTGHSIKLLSTSKDASLRYNGQNYTFLQMHYHSPSEHTIYGKPYPVEFHFVHADTQGKLAVVGVFAKVGKEANPAVAEFLKNAPRTVGGTNRPETGKMNLNDFFPKDNIPYMTYDGSLTTPPCTQGVKWIVLSKPITISQKQLQELATLYSHNHRPVQPLEGRKVLLNQ